MKEALRAVGYGRVSTEEQQKTGTSLRDQFAGNHQKAKEIGAAMVSYFEDSDSGAFYLTRQGLQNALKTLEDGKANCLIVKDLSRLTRNDRAEQATILKRIKDAKAALVFWDVTYEDSPMGEFSLNVTGDFAILEKAVIRDRTMRGRRRTAAEGRMPNRCHAPYGYIIPKKNDVIRGTYSDEQLGTYLLHPERAPIAEETFNRYASGESLHGICKWLQSSGIPTTNGGRFWYPTNIVSMLDNPAYYGKAAFGRTKIITDESRALQGYKRRNYKVAVPEEEWILIDCPAIISKDLWEQCKRNRKENKERLSARPTRRLMFTGLLRCPKCHRAMAGRERKPPYHTHYRCKESNPASNSAGMQCWKKCLNASWLEPLLLGAVKEVIRQPEAVTAAYAAYQAARSSQYSEAECQRFKAELSDLTHEEIATAQAQVAGIRAGANPAVYEALLRDLALKRTALQTRLDELAKVKDEAHLSTDHAEIARTLIATVEEVLDNAEGNLDNSEKHAMLSKVIESIYPDETAQHFTITFRGFTEGTKLIAEVGKDKPLTLKVAKADK
ncbi:MAG TPA: recombinase family protein [Abditibacteriaceae bacterium]|jgi:site-specific DNA recombinase